jgi:DNA-binding transcriptional regulator PaaX
MVLKRSVVAKFSEGLLATAVDLVLVSLFYGFEFMAAGYGKGWRAGRKAHEDLEEFNYETIKRAVVYLRQKGFVQTAKEKFVLPKITAQGKKRVNLILPHYDEKRVWDGRIYLVTYDLPVKQNAERNYLRDFLKKIGCGMLQQSVWLTPYNPTRLIKEFAEEKNLGEVILVSSLGKGGAIGEMSLPELMERVYHLDKLNERYQEFVGEARRNDVDKDRLVFLFLSILQDDPQLPFKLLPNDWLGEQAYKVFQRIVKE